MISMSTDLLLSLFEEQLGDLGTVPSLIRMLSSILYHHEGTFSYEYLQDLGNKLQKKEPLDIVTIIKSLPSEVIEECMTIFLQDKISFVVMESPSEFYLFLQDPSMYLMYIQSLKSSGKKEKQALIGLLGSKIEKENLAMLITYHISRVRGALCYMLMETMSKEDVLLEYLSYDEIKVILEKTLRSSVM